MMKGPTVCVVSRFVHICNHGSTDLKLKSQEPSCSPVVQDSTSAVNFSSVGKTMLK